MIWDREHECMSRSALESLQFDRLKVTLARVYDRVDLYRGKLDAAKIRPQDVASLSDIRKLPFTTKSDLRSAYPYGMFAVPLKDVVRFHTSTGTTGKPTVVGYTKGDLEMWGEICARLLTAAGVTSDDIAQVAFHYGLFTGGFGLHAGLEKIGASVIPASSGGTQRQIMLMRDFGATTLLCTPSYALHLGEEVQDTGVLSDLKLKWGIFGAEPWSERMRTEIESSLGLSATDNYGLSEIIGPGVSGECQECKCGLHIAEDHFLVEIIDPETLEALDYGKQGELVITTLTKEAVPLIRFRTGDITSISPQPCACGRTLARMDRVRNRTDDMLIIRGTNVFPSQVETALTDIQETKPHYMVVVYKEGALDALEIWVEVSEHLFSDEMKGLQDTERLLTERIEAVLGLSVKLKLVEPRTIARCAGKAKRVVDLRDKE